MDTKEGPREEMERKVEDEIGEEKGEGQQLKQDTPKEDEAPPTTMNAKKELLIMTHESTRQGGLR